MLRLANPELRRRIARETVAGMAHRWTDLFISAVASDANRPAVGLHIHEIAVARSREPVEVVLDLLAEEQGAVNMLEFNQSRQNLRETLVHPLSNIVSDGFYVNGRPHPRLHGTFPHLLGGSAGNEAGWRWPKRSARSPACPPHASDLGTGDESRPATGRTWWSSMRRASAARPPTKIPNGRRWESGMSSAAESLRLGRRRTFGKRTAPRTHLLPDRDQQRAAQHEDASGDRRDTKLLV